MNLRKLTTLLLASVAWLLVPSTSHAALSNTVTFQWQDWQGLPLVNNSMRVTPAAVGTNAAAITTLDYKQSFTTDTNGIIVLTNMVYGGYAASLHGPIKDTTIAFVVPATNGDFPIQALLSTNLPNPNTANAYTIAAANANFVHLPSTNVPNGYVASATNGAVAWVAQTGGSGSQTPLTANVNGAGYTVSNATFVGTHFGPGTNTASTNFLGALGPGDVTGTQGATAVATVGGLAAASVASGANAANAANSSIGANQIVKRDSNGSFSANVMTGNVAGASTSSTLVTGSVGGSVALPAAQITGVASKTNGGNGFAQTNWVPSGTAYTNNADFGIPTYSASVLSNGVYFAYIPGNATSNDQDIIYLSDESGDLGHSGVFIPLTNHILLSATLVAPVLTQLYLIGYTNGFDTNSFYGDFNGRFVGIVDPTSTVPNAALGANVQLLSNPLSETASTTSLHVLRSLNSTSSGSTFDAGSTLSLKHAGPLGYADINFETVAAANSVNNDAAYTLWGAVGVHDPSTTSQFPYNQLYFESYLAKYPWYFVGNNQIFGGLFCTPNNTDGDFIWFGPAGTTNDVMFRINRANHVISNYYNAVFQSNVTAASVTLSSGATNGNYVKSGAGGLLYTTNAVPATDLSGTVPDARFPATLPAASGVNLTALNGTQVTTGTVADARLSANVALLNAAQTFSASNTFTGGVSLNNTLNTISGNGGGLTNLQANSLAVSNNTATNIIANLSGAVSVFTLMANTNYWLLNTTNGPTTGVRYSFRTFGATNGAVYIPTNWLIFGTNYATSAAGSNWIFTVTNGAHSLVATVWGDTNANTTATNTWCVVAEQ